MALLFDRWLWLLRAAAVWAFCCRVYRMSTSRLVAVMADIWLGLEISMLWGSDFAPGARVCPHQIGHTQVVLSGRVSVAGGRHGRAIGVLHSMLCGLCVWSALNRESGERSTSFRLVPRSNRLTGFSLWSPSSITLRRTFLRLLSKSMHGVRDLPDLQFVA